MKKRMYAVCCAVLLLFLAGCKKEAVPQENPQEGWYTVYYQGNSYKTVARVVHAQETTAEKIAEELFLCMKEPDEGTEGVSIVPDTLELLQAKLDGQVLSLYFNSEYLEMETAQEVICRAALAKTMTQIPGVEYISVYVGTQPLMDRNGAPVGNLSSSDFVNVIGKDVNTIQHTTFTLYFASAEGDKLVGEEMEVTYSNTASVEEFIVEQLIEGPGSDSDLQPVLPENTQLLGVSVRDGICYVNFSSDVLAGMSAVTPEISVYAVVNSLTSLPYITQVQITVNGSGDQSLIDVPLSEPFYRNLDYVLNVEEENP